MTTAQYRHALNSPHTLPFKRRQFYALLVRRRSFKRTEGRP
jgi:hypothetical protein